MPKQRAIADFLARLSSDPALRRRFRENPSDLADEAGLSNEELELLSGGDSDQIRNYFGDDATVNCFALFSDDGGSSS